MAELKDSSNYETDFDPEWYLKIYYGSVDAIKEDENSLNVFILKFLHEVFETGELTGARLLDVGTGPTIHSVISASRHVQRMDLSDYAAKNRATLQEWLDTEKIQSSEIMTFVMGLENDRRPIADRNNDIKKKVLNVFRIDVTDENVIKDVEVQPTYDVITSSLCLEAATNSLKEYETVVNNVTHLLKKGGFIILIGVLNQSFYVVGNCKFPSAKLSKQEVRSTFENCGFEIKTWKEIKISDSFFIGDTQYADCDSVFAMMAQKQI